MTYIKTVLKSSLVIDSIVTIHYFEYMTDFIFRGESHNFWEFLYVDNGTICARADDTEYILKTGDVIFHKPNEFHAIKSVGKSSPNLVVASFHTHSEAMSFFENKHFTLGSKERMLLSKLIAEARNAFSTPLHVPSVEQVIIKDNPAFASEQLIRMYLEFFLIMLFRKFSSGDSSSTVTRVCSPQNESTRTATLSNIIHFMQFHISEHLKVSDICNAFSTSRSELQSLFHDKKGCGIIEYFNDMKIQRAKHMIRDGKMNLSEISDFLSYSSLSYFSKAFKKATGMSPLEYSRSVKGITEALKNVPEP